MTNIGAKYEAKQQEWELWVRTNLGGGEVPMRAATDAAMHAVIGGASAAAAAEEARNAWAIHTRERDSVLASTARSRRHRASLRHPGRSVGHATKQSEVAR